MHGSKQEIRKKVVLFHTRAEIMELWRCTGAFQNLYTYAFLEETSG